MDTVCTRADTADAAESYRSCLGVMVPMQVRQIYLPCDPIACDDGTGVSLWLVTRDLRRLPALKQQKQPQCPGSWDVAKPSDGQ